MSEKQGKDKATDPEIISEVEESETVPETDCPVMPNNREIADHNAISAYFSNIQLQASAWLENNPEPNEPPEDCIERIMEDIRRIRRIDTGTGLRETIETEGGGEINPEAVYERFMETHNKDERSIIKCLTMNRKGYQYGIWNIRSEFVNDTPTIAISDGLITAILQCGGQLTVGCPQCEGKGFIVPKSDHDFLSIPCATCGGSGVLFGYQRGTGENYSILVHTEPKARPELITNTDADKDRDGDLD